MKEIPRYAQSGALGAVVVSEQSSSRMIHGSRESGVNIGAYIVALSWINAEYGLPAERL